MAFLEPFVLILIILILFYKWSTAKFNVLNERRVPHFKPQPFIGNFGMDILLGKNSLEKLLIELQLKFRNNKVYGMYIMRDPIIFVQDAELIKKVCVEDFHNFINHKSGLEITEIDLGRNLFILKDQEWREMRDILTPTFTSNRMRAIFELIEECCFDGINYLSDKMTENSNQVLELKMIDVFSRFTNDVILSAVLGIKVASFRQKENYFYEIGSTVIKSLPSNVLKVAIFQSMPRLMKILGLRIFKGDKIRHFNSLVQSTIKYREQHNIVRLDMIQLLMEAKKLKTSKYCEFNDNDIVAQCLLFFCTGFGKLTACLCFTAYELMANPDVQKKLLQEIQEVQEKLNGKSLNYDTLIGMKYMDMVISETLRKWPPLIYTNRVCKQDYDLRDDVGNIVVKLKKNDDIAISILGLHHDPANFEHPEKFVPERFAEENLKNIRPFTYLPFGVGPRMCLGNRFALVEIKAILYYILLRYKIVSSANTKVAIQRHRQVPDTYFFKLYPRNYSS